MPDGETDGDWRNLGYRERGSIIVCDRGVIGGWGITFP